jgi:GNAT superfamily N-acetyltransferase
MTTTPLPQNAVLADIHFATDRTVSPGQLASVFARSGINRPVHKLDQMANMAASADLLVSAWHGDTLIGVARSLTDFCAACYLADLAVDRDYQQYGIGRRLVQYTRDCIGEDTMLLLLAAPSAMAYYPKIGFTAVANAWSIRPQQWP